MKTFRKLLRKFVDRALFHLVAAYFWARYLFYDSLRFYKKVHFAQDHPGMPHVWAVVAAQPAGGRLSDNLLKAISLLRETGIAVLLVVSGKLQSRVLTALGQICDVLIEQFNAGRDFGAYKTGFEYLHTRDDGRIRKVLFLNDSVIFLPNRFKALLDNVVTANWDFLGITESYEKQYHVSSYFWGVSDDIFRSSWFSDYWRSFRRMSFRPYVIKFGELKLSSVITRHGHQPFVVFPITRVMNLFDRKDASSTPPAGDLLLFASAEMNRLARDEALPRGVCLWGAGSLPAAALLSCVTCACPRLLENCGNNFLASLSSEMAVRSTVHHFNLLLVAHLDFPFIKRDLVKRGVYEPTMVDYFFTSGPMQGDDDGDHVIGYVREMLRSADTVRWTRGFRGVLLRQGVI
jgi:hypothetical protein